MVLIQKRSYKTVADVGTDPMDGESLVSPLHESAVVGSVVDANSVGDHHTAHMADGVSIRCLVSLTCS